MVRLDLGDRVGDVVDVAGGLVVVPRGAKVIIAAWRSGEIWPEYLGRAGTGSSRPRRTSRPPCDDLGDRLRNSGSSSVRVSDWTTTISPRPSSSRSKARSMILSARPDSPTPRSVSVDGRHRHEDAERERDEHERQPPEDGGLAVSCAPAAHAGCEVAGVLEGGHVVLLSARGGPPGCSAPRSCCRDSRGAARGQPGAPVDPWGGFLVSPGRAAPRAPGPPQARESPAVAGLSGVARGIGGGAGYVVASALRLARARRRPETMSAVRSRRGRSPAISTPIPIQSTRSVFTPSRSPRARPPCRRRS